MYEINQKISTILQGIVAELGKKTWQLSLNSLKYVTFETKIKTSRNVGKGEGKSLSNDCASQAITTFGSTNDDYK